jgi:hypothetical protein
MDVSVEESSGSFTTNGCDATDRRWRDGRSYLNTNHSITDSPCRRVMPEK